MIKHNDSNIPENLFAEVTLGNNGVRIVGESKTPYQNIVKKTDPIYLSYNDIREILSRVYPSGTTDVMDSSIEKKSDEIIDANY